MLTTTSKLTNPIVNTGVERRPIKQTCKQANKPQTANSKQQTEMNQPDMHSSDVVFETRISHDHVPSDQPT
jgi:hypothetical protein